MIKVSFLDAFRPSEKTDWCAQSVIILKEALNISFYEYLTDWSKAMSNDKNGEISGL